MFENHRFAVIDSLGNRAQFIAAVNILTAAEKLAGSALYRLGKDAAALAEFYAVQVSPEQEAAIEAARYGEDQLELIENLSPETYRRR